MKTSSVVAGVAFVRDEVLEIGGAQRQVGVDLDPRMSRAEEPVVAAPGLTGHHGDLEILRAAAKSVGAPACAGAGEFR